MGLFNIIELTKQYVVLGMILAAFIGVIAGAGYFVVYKKIMKGEKRIRPLNVLWAGVVYILEGKYEIKYGTYYKKQPFLE